MLPLTSFLSCTALLDEFDCLPHHNRYPAKTYVMGLITSRNQTIEGIANHVMPSATTSTTCAGSCPFEPCGLPDHAASAVDS